MWASLDDNGQHLYFDSETAYLDFVETQRIKRDKAGMTKVHLRRNETHSWCWLRRQRMVDDLAAVDCVLCAESHTFYVEFCDVRIPAASRTIV